MIIELAEKVMAGGEITVAEAEQANKGKR